MSHYAAVRCIDSSHKGWVDVMFLIHVTLLSTLMTEAQVGLEMKYHSWPERICVVILEGNM